MLISKPFVITIFITFLMEYLSSSPTKMLTNMRTIDPFPRQYAINIPLTMLKEAMAESPSLPEYLRRILFMTIPLKDRQNIRSAPGKPIPIRLPRSLHLAFLKL